MKLSSRIKRCGLSPMRQFYPSEVAAVSRGLKVYHMNIGQPDIETPPVFLEEVRRYQGPVVPYAPAPGEKAYLKAVQAYYGELGCALEEGEILADGLEADCRRQVELPEGAVRVAARSGMLLGKTGAGEGAAS